MNEVITGSPNMPAGRTPSIIAAEINQIKDQTRKMVLFNSIEIGRRLIEAKTLIQHGEWGRWLEETVNYSQRTANNLMRIFEEYGADQITLLGNNAKSQALANLSYTQAVALLGIPEEERESFVVENDVENMSTRDLQKAIKEKEQALKENEELKSELEKVIKNAQINEQAYKKVSESYDRLEETNKKHYQRASNLEEELKEAKQRLEEAESAGDKEEAKELKEAIQRYQEDLNGYREKIEELERQLQERPVEVNAETIIEKIPEEVEKELKDLREKANQSIESNKPKIRFSIYFEELVKGFDNLLGTLEAIKSLDDPEAYQKHRNAVAKLIEKMKDNL